MKEDIAGVHHVLELHLGLEIALLNLLHNDIKLDVLCRLKKYYNVKVKDGEHSKLKSRKS